MENLITVADINVGGQKIEQFVQVRISQRFEFHHEFEIQVRRQDLQLNTTADLQRFANSLMGKATVIKIRQLVGNSERQSSTFSGIVTSIQLGKNRNAEPEILISGVSSSALLEAQKHTRSFTKQSLSDIVKKICSAHNSDIKLKASPAYTTPIDYVVQYQEDSFHFLQRLAENYGEWFFYDGETLYFGKNAYNTPKTVDLVYGSDFDNLEYNFRLLPVQFRSSYYQYESNEVYTVPSSDISVAGLSNFSQSALNHSEKLFSEPDVDITLQGFQNKNALKRAVELKKSDLTNRMAVFSGSSRNADLRIGGLVKITDLRSVAAGDAISHEKDEVGTFLITRLSHHLDSAGSYYNTFDGIPQKDPAFPPVDYNIIAPRADAQPAIVKDTNDPENMGRVKVRFFWQNENETTPWIRVAMPMSSKERGVYFVPEVDETVFIGFEFGNPDLPYVTGSMYHGKGKPGMLFDKENNIKGIITKGGNHILINDKSGKEEISFYNKDKKNLIQLTLDGTQINIKSPDGKINLEAKEINMKAENINVDVKQKFFSQAQDITLDAKANINANAQSAVKIKGTSQVSIESSANLEAKGSQVKIEGQAQTSVKGGAQLQLEGGAQATLKAGMVMIN